jgi:hypothetical protein
LFSAKPFLLQCREELLMLSANCFCYLSSTLPC